MDQKFFHSVRLDKEKCKGCTNCLKRCPTEAIRVRGGRAHIINERCIDCGECIRVCDYHAKYAQTDPLASINRFKYKIALPAPSLYGQFKHLISASQVLFAIGATLKVDYNGTLRVEGLWDGQSTEIDAGHMHAGGSVEYSTPVTQVIVTEHAYTANATETTELFNGTTAAGDKITFDEPCYDLAAEGFSISL